MPNTSARRLGAILLPFALLIMACGRLSESVASDGSQTEGTSVGQSLSLPTVDSPMLAEPHLSPWTGGNPEWVLSWEKTQWILQADVTNAYDRQEGLPEYCYSDAPDRNKDREMCFFPILRELGVSDDAARFYVENDLVVLGLLGSGPVKVARMWWGPAGAQDTYTPAAIFVPGGYISAAPSEWAPYATALREAYASDTYGEIAAIEGISDGYPLTFSEIAPSRIGPPARTASGWSVSVTALLRGGCIGCDIEFAGRFVLEFSEEGTPSTAGFGGFCLIPGYDPGRQPDFDSTKLDALRTELPTCPEETQWPRD